METPLLYQNDYDPFKSPPDFDLAFNHALARRVCKSQKINLKFFKENLFTNNVPLQEFKERQQIDKLNNVCPCCNLVIQNEQIEICCKNSELMHLGGNLSKQLYLQVTFPLYFQYIKKCAWLFFIQLLLSGIFDIITNMHGQTCSERYTSNFICQPSFLNILNVNTMKNLKMQSLFNFVNLLVMIIMIEFFKVHQEIERFNIENNQVVASDFTVEVSGFRPVMNISYIEQFFGNYQIVKIYCIFDMEKYKELYTQKKKLHYYKNKVSARLRELRASTMDQLLNQSNEELELTQLIEITDQNIVLTDNELEKFSLQNNKDFSGRILVTLESHEDCRKLIRNWKVTSSEWWKIKLYKLGYRKVNLERFMYMARLMKVKKASHPSDYIWTNLGAPAKTKFKTRIYLQLSVLTIFTLSFVILLFLKRKIKKQQSLYESAIISISFSFIASTIVAGANTLIGIFLRFFAGLETHKRQTSYFVSVGRNLSYLFFINMVCTTLISNMLAINSSISDIKGFPFNLEDLMSDFFFLFITNTYLSSIFNYFDIVYGYKLFFRWYHLKKKTFSWLSQQQANQLYGGHPVDMALRYANIQKVMFFTAAVSGFLPFGIPLSLLGLLICYWFDKYLLLRRYICSHQLDKRLANAMMQMLPLYVVFYSIGNVIIMCIPVFNNQTIATFTWPNVYQSAYFYLSMLGLLISLAYWYLAKIPFIQKWFYGLLKVRIPKKGQNLLYSEEKQFFSEDYDTFYPPSKIYLPNGENKQFKLFEDIRNRIHEN